MTCLNGFAYYYLNVKMYPGWIADFISVINCLLHHTDPRQALLGIDAT